MNGQEVQVTRMRIGRKPGGRCTVYHQLMANERSIRPWPLVKRQVLGDHRIFTLTKTVRSSPSGAKEHSFIGLEAPDWVNVIALTGDGCLILIEQYRHGTDSLTLEIPGGAVDPGEDPATAGRRELEEETGYQCQRLELLGWVEPNPAFLDNRCWTYLALGCRPEGQVNFDPAEDIRIELSDLEGFTSLINDGTIRHSLVIAAHDHLQRGLAAGASWTADVRALGACSA